MGNEAHNTIIQLTTAVFGYDRNKRRQDNICSVWYIKDEDDRVLLHAGDITTRWGSYFSELFNAVHGRKIIFNQEIVHVPDDDAGASQDKTVDAQP